MNNGRKVSDKLRPINKGYRVILSSGFTRNKNVTALNDDGLKWFYRQTIQRLDIEPTFEKSDDSSNSWLHFKIVSL